jgi:hypothetical protein
MYETENSVIHIDRSEKSVINIYRGPLNLRGWRRFPSHVLVSGLRHACFFLTVLTLKIGGHTSDRLLKATLKTWPVAIPT